MGHFLFTCSLLLLDVLFSHSTLCHRQTDRHTVDNIMPMHAAVQSVLLSRTWDSRTRTRTRSQASRTRTRTWCPRTWTWKLVLEDKDFPRGQQHCKHRVSNKHPGLLEIQSCQSTSHTLVTS